MIVFVLEYAEAEVVRVGDVDEVVVSEETIGGHRPKWFRISEMSNIERIGWKGFQDVVVE